MIRRALFPGVLLVLGLHASVLGDIINVPGDQPSIQAAIDAAVDGDEIVVAPGTYFENINLLGKAVTLRSSAGPEVTIIDANGSGTVVKCVTGEGPDTIIDGFTITGGNATGGSPADRGGGMLIISSPTVNNCTLTGNTAKQGGGVFNNSGSPTFTHCTFSGNTADHGGGMYNNAETGNAVAAPTLLICSFVGNQVIGRGGAIHSVASTGEALVSPKVIGCILSGNSATLGGATYNKSITGEAATRIELMNSTLTQNHATRGSAIFIERGIGLSSAHLSIFNSIVWDNPAVDGPQILRGSGVTAHVAFSDIEGNSTGLGNIDADPLFIDADGPDDVPGTEDDDLRVPPGSPVIDAADNTAVPADSADLDHDADTDEPIPVDLDGKPRFVDDPDTPDTGRPDGINPLVDMGAYEFGPPDLCADDDGDGRVTICHIPPGNPDNAHTITVGANAVPAHLAHGDHCGACEEDPGLLMGSSRDVKPESCPSDLDDSGDVGAEDLAQLLGNWGPCAGCPADFNGDGIIGAADLAVLLGAWGPCP